MTVPLERLVYESTATGSTTSLLNLVAILGESQRNNDRAGLTGALAAHGERYIQVVEGSAGALDGLLLRLGRDKRHRDIVILERSPIAARAFADWSMASARVTPELAPALDALMAAPGGNADRIAVLLKDALTRQAAEIA